MKIRYALILAASLVLLLSGCATGDEGRANEAHVKGLMRERSWPRIQQIAAAECKKREKILRWPDDASYLPVDHKDKMWAVAAMTGTPNGDMERTIILGIADDGAVLTYKRYWKGDEIPELDQRR